MKCDGSECASQDAVKKLLGQLMATMYFIDEKVEFKRNLGGSPLKTIDAFHSQFQIEPHEYRDNNNFLVHN